MLLDLIEMKERGWSERRAQEGPRTIEEIHKDAAREQAAARDRSRGWSAPSRSRSGDDGRGSSWRGIGAPPSALARQAPSPTPPITREEFRPLTRVKSFTRTDSQEISLRPGAMVRPLSREMSAPLPRVGAGSPVNSSTPDRPSGGRQQPKTIQEEPRLTGEVLDRKVKSLVEEFYEIKDLEEAQKCFDDLKQAGAMVPEILASSVSHALNIRGIDAATRLVPLGDLFISLAENHAVDCEELEKGLELMLSKIPEIAEDFPKAPELVGKMLGDLVVQEIIDLAKVGEIVLQAGKDDVPSDQDTMLIDSGASWTIILEVMKFLKEQNAVKTVKDWLDSKQVDIAEFRASYERNDVKPTEVLKFLDD